MAEEDEEQLLWDDEEVENNAEPGTVDELLQQDDDRGGQHTDALPQSEQADEQQQEQDAGAGGDLEQQDEQQGAHNSDVAALPGGEPSGQQQATLGGEEPSTQAPEQQQASGQSGGGGKQDEEPKRRFPPARIKPLPGNAPESLHKALGAKPTTSQQGQATASPKHPAAAPAQAASGATASAAPQRGAVSAAKAAAASRSAAAAATTATSGKAGVVRYFILRSNNQDNIDIAFSKSGWATQKFNEQRLDEAYANSDEVRLVFSGNGSSHFSGYAVMRSAVGAHPNGAIIWSSGKRFGQEFALEWRVFNPLPFDKASHLLNPLNENKPVGLARDGTELPRDVGDQLVALMEQQARAEGKPLLPMRPTTSNQQ